MSWFPESDTRIKEHTYIINLKSRLDKRRLIKYKLNTFGLNDYTFFDAVNGTDPMYDDLYDIVESKGKYTSKGAFGLVITYINLLEDAYKNGYERILILEDDVNLHKNYFDLVKKFTNVINDTKYDIIWLGANQRMFSKQQLDSIDKGEPYLPESQKNNYTYGTFSIMINRSGIVKMLKVVNSRNIINLKPIDIVINDMIRSNTIKGVVCYPFLFMPDVSDSDNMGPRSQLKFTKSRRFVSSDYNYVSQQDIIILHDCYKKDTGIDMQKVNKDKKISDAYNRVIKFLSKPVDINDLLTY